MCDRIAGSRLRAEVIKGTATPFGLYSTLYKYSDSKCVVVFDDCDDILLDSVSLTLLKGALNTGRHRKISWLADSHSLRREGIPDTFDFQGSVIFISNLKFDKMKSPKLKEHLDALQSRCHYLDLTINTMREKILRVKQIARDSDLFDNTDLSEHEQNEIIEFMEQNKDKLREVSLRMAIKLAQLRNSFGSQWTEIAKMTCMSPG